MPKFNLPHFGEINLSNLDSDYRTQIDYMGRKISIDINFNTPTATVSTYNTLKKFIENLEHFDTQNRIIVENDYIREGETSDYIEFYFDEFDEKEMSIYFDPLDTKTPKEIQFLRKHHLIRVGMYPDSDRYYGVFDYAIYIEGEPSNQLLVVKTDKNGNLDHVTWES